MTTITYPQQRNNLLPVIFILAIVICAIALYAVICSPHADTKHADAVASAQTCHNYPQYRFHNPVTDRFMDVCQIDGNFFVWIWQRMTDGSWRNISAFQKEKMSRIEQVLQYVKNAGYDIDNPVIKP